MDDVRRRWKDALAAAPLLPGDREAVATLLDEADVALEPLAAALEQNATPASPGFRDVATAFLRLGRRTAELGASPTAAGAAVPALGAAAPLPHAVLSALAGAFLEGFVQAREEILREGEVSASADASPVLVLGDVVVALPTGRLGEDGVRRFRERLERTAFRSSARAVVMDLSHLVDADADAISEAFALDEGARMLGARAVFVTTRPAPPTVETAPSLDEALRRVGERGLRLIARLFRRR